MYISKEEFEEKYNLYSQELMNISYGYTRNRDDSLDVIQNVFYKFFIRGKSFSNLQEEKYWLIRITINECKDLLRKKSRVVILDEDTINSISFSKTTDEDDLKFLKLTEKVEQLPEKYKVVIILFYYDSLPIKEIVKILNVSESAVKKRLERARNMLKIEMED